MIANKQIDEMLRLFPQLKYSTDYITKDVSYEKQYEQAMIPAAQMKMKKVFEDVSNNLSKRLKEILSPGNQLANSRGNRVYRQIMLQDVENSSEVLNYLVKLNYPNLYNSVIEDIKEFKILDNIYENNRNALQKAKHEELLNKLKDKLPKIAGFLKTASTDAQEYVSWKDNLNQLLDQGRLFENSKGKHTYSSPLQNNTLEKCLSEIELNEEMFIKRAVFSMLKDVDAVWKRGFKDQTENVFSSGVIVEMQNPSDWGKINRTLSTIDIIKQYRFKTISNNAVELELKYLDSPIALSQKLYDNGIAIFKRGDKTVMKLVKN
jgi:predicted double-glycine peptidase